MLYFVSLTERVIFFFEEGCRRAAENETAREGLRREQSELDDMESRRRFN